MQARILRNPLSALHPLFLLSAFPAKADTPLQASMPCMVCYDAMQLSSVGD